MLPLADAPSRQPPDGIALIHRDERWTWARLDERSAAWAARLRGLGVKPDDLVAFVFPNGPDFFALTFGVYRAGATPAPLSPKLPESERDAILDIMRPGSVGKPTGGARLRILGPHGEDLPAGVEGEIYAMPPGGPGASYRYIGAEPRATADGWETVGDVGWVDADGYLFLADRRADLIITGGVNVWPAEVEAALLRHPAIRSCAVVGRPDDDLGQRVHAIVEADDAALDLKALREFLAPHLAREKHPRALEIQNAPVRDDAGKTRKALLKETHYEPAAAFRISH